MKKLPIRMLSWHAGLVFVERELRCPGQSQNVYQLTVSQTTSALPSKRMLSFLLSKKRDIKAPCLWWKLSKCLQGTYKSYNVLVCFMTLQNSYDLWPSGGSLLLHFSDQSTGVQRVQESWNMLEEFNKSLQDHGSFQVSAIISCLVSGAGENHWCSTRPSPEKVMDSGKIPYLKTCILWRGNQNKIGTHQ